MDEHSLNKLAPEHQQLFMLLIEANKKQTEEIKNEFQQVIRETKTPTKEVETLKKRCIYLECKTRKNNIVIFGIKSNSLGSILNQLNAILEINLQESDVNNFYTMGRTERAPIVIEFNSYLKKLTLFHNRENLRGLEDKGISIANDLCQEYRED
ncbi:hypothetical protein JTB14_006781 [Gonioctena quinquepunctata]|nr:hypothetical protein JTB14_006781 [Gonioctena quinquepunctata]